tara:strand:- start:3835 stop:5988 length:2154 start_codon:yes stop_codon:yes gene_type:complete
MLINNSLFKLEEIPKYNPVTQRFKMIDFWKGEKRKCIEGYWQSGKWMSGPLYFYVNFFPIRRESEKSMGQPLDLPNLRDIDWELFLYYEECRGFSGFSLDKEYTCLRAYGPDRETAEKMGFKFDPNLKYISAREYLRKIQITSLGKPLYENSSQNFISIQARGSGKTYSSACIGAHNYLFGGVTDYDYYLENKERGVLDPSETLIGAIKAAYSGQLVKKVREGLENLKGSYKVNGIKYVSPLQQQWSGNWEPGSNTPVTSIVNGSIIYHRTFHDNPLAGNGTRSNVFLFDEVGFWDNIIESWAATEGAEVSKQFRRQVIWALGTGGLVKGQAALHVEHMFRNPSSFNAIEFDDIFENKGVIGYFVPITRASNRFKEGLNLVTNEAKAIDVITYERDKLKENSNKKAYLGMVINAPLVPSEAFLSEETNEFPSYLIREQLSELATKPELTNGNWVGELKFQGEDLQWIDRDDLKPITNFPIQSNESKEGAIVLYEKPSFDWPVSNPYVAGTDTVDKIKSTTDSLFSVFVKNRWTGQIAAEFTGRREDPNDHYEIVRRLCLYFRCRVMYEQQLTGIFAYFNGLNQTYLLEDTPSIHRNRDTFVENSNTGKGIGASANVNKEGRKLLKSWLLTPVSEKTPDYRIVNTIKSIPLLQEMLYWNQDGNFDRISAMVQVAWYDQALYKKKEDEETAENQRKLFLESSYFNKFKKKQNINEFQFK